MENLRILERPEGVALVLSDKLLFPEGGAGLTPAAKQLLDVVAQVLLYTAAPVNISGYTDAVGGGAEYNYILSGMRSLAVLRHFLERGQPDERFSISGYGPNWPIDDNDTEEGRASNRRVEILLKTTPWLGAYVH